MATSSELEEELAGLEAELLELRHDPDPEPAPSGRGGRRTRLRKELAALEAKIEKRHRALGTRELTPRESAALATHQRFSLIVMAVGVAILCGHLAWRARLHMTWRETTCTLSGQEDGYDAHYEAHGRSYQFYAGEKDRGSSARCWVPEPPHIEDLGRLEAPKTPAVSVWKKLSFGWVFGPLCVIALGAMFLVLNELERRKRLANLIEKDDFPTSAD